MTGHKEVRRPMSEEEITDILVELKEWLEKNKKPKELIETMLDMIEGTMRKQGKRLDE